MTDHSSPDRAALIAEAERLLRQITPGDWMAEFDSCAHCGGEWDISDVPSGSHGRFERQEDAEFIAAAPRLLRALLAVVREGEQEKARYENAQCITCARDLDALASRASAPERWACLACSEAAGVVNDPVRHVSHALGEACPLNKPAPEGQPGEEQEG